jgi:hypothetical protein
VTDRESPQRLTRPGTQRARASSSAQVSVRLLRLFLRQMVMPSVELSPVRLLVAMYGPDQGVITANGLAPRIGMRMGLPGVLVAVLIGMTVFTTAA